MNKASLINQTSGKVEYYTDPKIIEAARNVMYWFDLDPASSTTANKTVQASRIYTYEDDGLVQQWTGKVWLNWPFGAKENACEPNCQKEKCSRREYHLDRPFPGNAAWVNKLVAEYRSGRVREAMCICFACTSEKWFQPLYDYPICFLSPRTNYYLPNGKKLEGVTKGSCVTYLGPHDEAFIQEFDGKLGRVK